MALSVVGNPADCLIGTGRCFELIFTSDDLTEQNGILPVLSITAPTFDDFVTGSKIIINGIEFTAAAALNVTTNEFELDAGNSGNTLDSLFILLGQNYYFDQNTTLVLNNAGVGFVYSLNTCDNQWTVTFENVDPVPTASWAASYTPLVIRDGFKTLFNLKKRVSESAALESIGEINIPISSLTLSSDKCNVSSHQMAKDISGLINTQFDVPLPTITPTNLFNPFRGGALKIGGAYTEFYNNNPHSLGIIPTNSEFFVVPGSYEKDNSTDRLTDYCVTAGFDLMTPYKNLDTVCSGGMNWAYMAIEEPGNKVADIRATVYTGNTITDNFAVLESLAVQDEFGIEIPIGICQLEPFFPSGAAACDVTRITLSVDVQLDTGGTVATAALDLYVDCCRDVENFAFKNRFGYFSGITTREFKAETFEVLSEYIELCDPCIPRESTRTRRAIRVEKRERFEACLTRNHSLDVVKEFLSSDEVYLVRDGKFYAIEMEFDSSEIDQLKTPTDIVFEFSLV